MKAWETPAWWPSFLKTDRTEPLVVTPAQYKKLVRGCAVAVVVIVIAAGIGITADGSVTYKVYKKPATDVMVGLRGV